MAEPEIERFKLTVKMDATITVYDATGQASDWLKPGTEASCTWKGLPSEAEVALRYQDLANVAKVTLEDVLTSSRNRLDEARRGG